MRILLFCIGVAVVITSLGCQRTSDSMTSGETATEPTAIAQTKLAQTAERPRMKLTATEHAQRSESEDHDNASLCPCGKGQGTGAGRGKGDGKGDGNGECKGAGQGTGRGHGMGKGMGRGMGKGMGRGMGHGAGAMGGMREDMTTLHAMFADRDKIKRTVTILPDGAETVTESDDEAIVSMIQEHVPAMEERVLGDKPLPPMTFHPIFVGLMKHSEDYTLTYEETAKGMKVKYSADNPYVVMLVQEHAKLVSRFIKNGMSEIHKPYTLPELAEETKESSVADSPANEETQ